MGGVEEVGINVLLDWHAGHTKEGKTTISGTRTMSCNVYLQQGRSLCVCV